MLTNEPYCKVLPDSEGKDNLSHNKDPLCDSGTSNSCHTVPIYIT